MSTLYCAEEMQILYNGIDAGHTDKEIHEAFASAGFHRSVAAIKDKRRTVTGPRGFRSPNEEERNPSPTFERHRNRFIEDAKFKAAMRAAHPDIKDGFAATEPSRSVPLRSLPRPLFSSTGVMS
ncbi:hypothetical protein V5F34_00930 [Xanthobacter autotrophicus]|uniref:hypothetical protein n=1 Tax=Xanthobacter autotrophicus TaxID=280 RepID=UPI003727D8F0